MNKVFVLYPTAYAMSLKLVLPISLASGITSSFVGYSSNDNTSSNQFLKTISYSTIGICSGILYPISFPLLTLYSLYKGN